jgi:hypothetical protein
MNLPPFEYVMMGVVSRHGPPIRGRAVGIVRWGLGKARDAPASSTAMPHHVIRPAHDIFDLVRIFACVPLEIAIARNHCSCKYFAKFRYCGIFFKANEETILCDAGQNPPFLKNSLLFSLFSGNLVVRKVVCAPANGEALSMGINMFGHIKGRMPIWIRPDPIRARQPRM